MKLLVKRMDCQLDSGFGGDLRPARERRSGPSRRESTTIGGTRRPFRRE
jgi:hypothetical protein